MMIISLNSRFLTVSSPVSVGTFIKHLWNPRKPVFKFIHIRARKTIFTSAALDNPHFQTLNSHQRHQIGLYMDSLLQWNQKMNLTAVKDENEVMERHVEDSLAIVEPICSSYISCCGSSFQNLSVVDVGSGAGLPGIILAIACPGWKVTLLESMNKRCVFMEHVVGSIGLQNVQVIWERAEEEVAKAERAIHLMAASLLQTCFVESHSKYGQRTAIICRKNGHTPKKYPRLPGDRKI